MFESNDDSKCNVTYHDMYMLLSCMSERLDDIDNDTAGTIIDIIEKNKGLLPYISDNYDNNVEMWIDNHC